MLVMEQLESLLRCFSGIVMVTLHPKVHIVDTDGLFPVQSLDGDTSGGREEWGTMFLMRAVWQRVVGQLVCPTKDFMLSSMAIVILTNVLLTCSATPFSCG